MKKIFAFLHMGVICILLLLLSACNLLSNNNPAADNPTENIPTDTTTDLPTEAPADTPPETAETPPIVYAEPVMGTQMRWHDSSLLIFIPDGNFIMGKSYEDNPQDHPEHPEHVVDQSGFWIYRSEVSNGMYANCVADGGCTEPATNITTDYLNSKKRNHPVVGVDWYQAQAYCSWADGHLPTESQWEKTARGTEGNLYPWGDAKPDCNLLNFDNCVNEKLSSGSYLSTTSPIRKYFDGESYYEALDMAGNVFEWTQDWYKSDYYQESPAADPPGPPNGEYKSVRSSAFRSTSSLVPSALRDSFLPNEYRDDLGFRCVIDKPPYYAPVCVYTPPRETEDCPPPTLDITDSYCQRDTGYVEFTVTEGAMVIYSGNTCAEISPNFYRCIGASGGYVNVQVCSDCEPVEEVCPPIQCANWYTLNTETCECEFSLDFGEEINWNIDGNASGLLFSLAPSLLLNPSPGCPPGFYWNDLAQKCVPADNPNNCDPAMGIIPIECEECPPGSNYDEESGCCEPFQRWVPELSAIPACANFILQLGECPDKQTVCTNPAQYTDAGSCGAAACKWVPRTVSVGYCTFP